MSILKRQALYSAKDGQFKFLDWAVTTTTLGTCAEPFAINDRGATNAGVLDYDPSDIMSRVDNLLNADDDDQVKRLLSSGPDQIHGGNLQPRVLIFAGNNRGSS